MLRRRLLLVAVTWLMVNEAAVRGDWKSEAAKRAIGKAARAGIEHAVKDAVADAAFDAVLGTEEFDQDVGDAMRRAALGSTASAGIEAAMNAADIASTIETAVDVVDTAKKINKARKVIGAIGKIR